MKKLYILLIIFTVSQLVYGQENEIKSHSNYKAYFSAGYAYTSLGSFKNYYDQIIDTYNYNGIPIPSHGDFKNSLLFEGGILLSRIKKIWFGISANYLYTPAFANYKDYLGTLKVNGAVNSFGIALIFKAELFNAFEHPILISVQPGLNYASANITEDLKYNEQSEFNYFRDWKLDAWGPSIKALITTIIPFGEFNLVPGIGYRYAWNKVGSDDLEKEVRNRFWSIDFGQNGIVFNLALEKEL